MRSSMRVTEGDSLGRVGSGLELAYLELAHLEHRLHGASCSSRVRIAEKLDETAWNDLPRHAPTILEPAAWTGLAAIRRERIPQSIHLGLVGTVDRERD